MIYKIKTLYNNAGKVNGLKCKGSKILSSSMLTTLLSLTCLLGFSTSWAGEDNTMTWAKPLETTQVDPHTAILGSSWQLMHLVYDGLVDVDDNLNPIPGIAESWKEESPVSYVFKLRKGVKFSNGREVTAADVVGSIKRVANVDTGSFWYRPIGPIKDVVAVDNHTVRITLDRPHAPLLAALAPTMASILPMKELNEGSFDPSKDFLGSGPYMVMSHLQDDHWILERNPHYWDEGLPNIEKLVIRIVPNDNARIAMLRDGSADIASFEASPDAPLLLREVPGIEVKVEDVTNYYFLGLNAIWDQSPFKSKKLRQAVALTLNRDQIRNTALGGAGEPTAVMAPAFEACNTSELPVFNKDIERAKALVKEEGAEGLSFELLVRSIPADIQMAQVIKQSVSEIGLEAKISVVDEGIWVKRAWIDNPSQFEAMVSWYAGYADPAISTLWWNPELAGFTAGHVEKDETLNSLISASYETVGEERGDVLQELCARIDENANVIPLVTRQDTIAFRKDRLDAEIDHVEGYVHTLRGIEHYKLLK